MPFELSCPQQTVEATSAVPCNLKAKPYICREGIIESGNSEDQMCPDLRPSNAQSQWETRDEVKKLGLFVWSSLF
jgi:hypothetical protein